MWYHGGSGYKILEGRLETIIQMKSLPEDRILERRMLILKKIRVLILLMITLSLSTAG
ncbi:hypothetical protein Sgly_3239 [Syntrophobotulus glycolicus DSM 8271]|uniref:Uncharacterized protein n=1 Tax=Syntrophobotulus glycolicus (strain DSM 8271 / FlGlyR) TaxID=645991 RepID=F0T275_SYNGF|nr:hypothetical protein Sgly_3239 [Syntrophobotulus glycolicus DSM 8271]